jgi:cyanate lyase
VTAILEARKRSGLTCAEVASAVGRNATWLGMAEIGDVSLQTEHEKIILTAIGRLERFQLAVVEAKKKLTADLKLPASMSCYTRGAGNRD